MSERTLLMKPHRRKRAVEISYEERELLNCVIDLIIPSDEHFPAPSSLHLIDELLHHLIPDVANHISLALDEERLRSILHDLNTSADSKFCKLSPDKQKRLLHRLEKRYPAPFQALWVLANHSYYARLATEPSISFA